MEFALSQDQTMLQDSVRKFLADSCPLDAVRAFAETQDNNALWQGLTELGVLGVMIDESKGGAGLGLLEAVLVAQSLGEVAAPAPYASNAVVAPLALQAGSAEQQDNYLPALAQGKCRIANGLHNPHGQLSAKDNKLSGKALFVLDSHNATHFLLAVEDTIYLLAADTQGVEAKPMPSIDTTRPTAELLLSNAPAEPIGNGKNKTLLEQCLLAGRILLAADSLGAMQTMLTKARDYALERKQFNRIIGSFQAVKHLCAEMAAEIEPCYALVWYAAHAFDKNLDDARSAGLYAKAHTSEVGKFVARTATEVHGGMGFTDLLGLHYWFKRLGYARQALGNPALLREQAALVQGWI